MRFRDRLPLSRPLPVLLALGIGLLAAPPAGAQAPVVGQVVDAQSGRPLFGALVAAPGADEGVLTDSLGRFTLRDLQAGDHRLVVSQLGYDTLHASVTVGEETPPVHLALQPDPIALEGIQVLADRFRRRRNAVATSVRAFDRSHLLTSASQDAFQFVRSRTGLIPTRCIGRSVVPCAWVRGRPEPIRVFIDDHPTVGGLDHLAMYRPEELYLVEIYSGGRMIRAYTNWFVSRAGERGWRPMPFVSF